MALRPKRELGGEFGVDEAAAKKSQYASAASKKRREDQQMWPQTNERMRIGCSWHKRPGRKVGKWPNAMSTESAPKNTHLSVISTRTPLLKNRIPDKVASMYPSPKTVPSAAAAVELPKRHGPSDRQESNYEPAARPRSGLSAALQNNPQ